MHSNSVASTIAAIQGGFQLVSLLHFTAYLWPPQANVQDGARYDYIIVGAGTAGSVIASRLTENENVTVLLVEAGGDPPLESLLPAGMVFLKRSNFDWNYTSEEDGISQRCHKKPYFEMTQGKMLGGTNSLDYMIYSRGHPTDYDSWAETVKDDSWKWENILPYFLKAEKLKAYSNLNASHSIRGTNGPLELTVTDRDYVNNLLESFHELGHNIVEDPVDGLGYAKMLLTLSDSGRQSSAHAYLTPAKDRINLHVLKEALVTKINIVDDKAVGVEIITKEGKTMNVKASKEIVVSAGAINSAKLLMLSGIGPKVELEKNNIKVIVDLPVGKNLQDHVSVVVPHSMEDGAPPPLNPNKYPAVSTVGYVALDKRQNYPDYQTMSYYAHESVIQLFCVYAFRLADDICDQMYKERKMGLFTEVVNVNPKSRGEIKLRSADPGDDPIIRTGYLSNEEDLDNLVKYVQDFIPVVHTEHFKRITAEMVNSIPDKCTEFEMGSTDYWKCYSSCLFSGLNYYAGTCGMGSVVDNRLRVYGVDNLRVADASIMPTIVKGNVAGSIIMIGEKAADMIKADNKL